MNHPATIWKFTCKNKHPEHLLAYANSKGWFTLSYQTMTKLPAQQSETVPKCSISSNRSTEWANTRSQTHTAKTTIKCHHNSSLAIKIQGDDPGLLVLKMLSLLTAEIMHKLNQHLALFAALELEYIHAPLQELEELEKLATLLPSSFWSSSPLRLMPVVPMQ